MSGSWEPEIRGYVTRAQDTVHLKDYDEVREALRIDYTKNDGTMPYPEGCNEYGIIRFKSSIPIEIPGTKEFGGHEAIWINDYGRQPFTGNGFTESENTIIPEYIFPYINDVIPLEAEFYRVIDGELKLVAVLQDKKVVLVQ
ncbi:hypothetical protein [Rubeoparvulum massiliense]|uniref:hypothetical protein n=1 Tax=Rubeoparvulum massiliense TaxID=1631346 RepID=UPI00065E379C|nr:hypothetical protein [Rubeoparvulum massiliense]